MSRQVVQFPLYTLTCDTQQSAEEIFTERTPLLCQSIDFDEERKIHLLKLH